MKLKKIQFIIFICAIGLCRAGCRNTETGKKKKCSSVIRAAVSGTSDKELFKNAWENQPSETIISKTTTDAASSSTSYELNSFYDPNYGFSPQSLEGLDFNESGSKDVGQGEPYSYTDAPRRQRPKVQTYQKYTYTNFPDYKSLLDKDNFQSQVSLTGGFKPLGFEYPQKYHDNYQDLVSKYKHPQHKYPEVDNIGKEYEKYLASLLNKNKGYGGYKTDSSDSEETNAETYNNFNKLVFGENNPYLANFYKYSQALNTNNNYEKPASFENSGFVPSTFGNNRPRKNNLNGRQRKVRGQSGRPNYNRYRTRSTRSRKQCRGSSCYEVIRRP